MHNETIIRLPNVKARTGLSRSSIFLKVKQGIFPPPICLGGQQSRAIGWIQSEIDGWITNQINASRSANDRKALSSKYNGGSHEA